MVDTRDLKSLGQKCPYGFDSHPGHKIHNTINKYSKVKQAKPDEVKSLDTKMNYGLRRTLIKIVSGLSSPVIA